MQSQTNAHPEPHNRFCVSKSGADCKYRKRLKLCCSSPHLKLKGKFLLSSYRNEALSQAVKQNNWRQIEIKMKTNPAGKQQVHTKIEVLTANYPIGVDTEELKLL